MKIYNKHMEAQCDQVSELFTRTQTCHVSDNFLDMKKWGFNVFIHCGDRAFHVTDILIKTNEQAIRLQSSPDVEYYNKNKNERKFKHTIKEYSSGISIEFEGEIEPGNNDIANAILTNEDYKYRCGRCGKMRKVRWPGTYRDLGEGCISGSYGSGHCASLPYR